MKYIFVPAGTPINSVIVSLESRHAKNSTLVSEANRITDIPMYYEVNDNVSIEHAGKHARLYTFFIKEERIWFCFNIQSKYIKEVE